MHRNKRLVVSALVPLLLLAQLSLSHARPSSPGSLSRRALQQAWGSAFSSANSDGSASASASISGSGSASAYASASSGGWQSNSGEGQQLQQLDQMQLPEQLQPNQDGQQQEQLVNDPYTSLLNAIQGGNGGNGQQQPQQQQEQQGQPDNTDAVNNSQQQQPQQTYTPTSNPSASGLSDYAQQSLDRHNLYRSRHQAAALRWSSSMASEAQTWANRCVFEHSGTASSGQGENIAWGYPDAVSAIDAYYSESSQYTYGQAQPADWHSVGHFTQMVWVATTDLGCAVASCNGGQLFQVCRYYPPGNVQGQYAENVLPPTS